MNPATTEKVRIIRVVVRQGDNSLLFATSPDLPGLHLAETSLDNLLAEAPAVIEALFASNGEHVIVREAVLPPSTDNDAPTHHWAAIPAHIAASTPHATC